MFSYNSTSSLRSVFHFPIGVSLKNLDEFEMFSPFIMEQSVSANGKMFIPEPIFILTGLEEKRLYRISMRFSILSDKNHKYQGDRWMETSTQITHIGNNIIHHPDGIQLGEHLNGEELLFKFKLTNKFYHDFPNNMIQLSTQGLYEAVLVVQPMIKDVNGLSQLDGTLQEFKFDCLKFMSVTKYKNTHVQAVKCSLNAFCSRETKMKKKEQILNARNTSRTFEPLSFSQHVIQENAFSSDCATNSNTSHLTASSESFVPTFGPLTPLSQPNLILPYHTLTPPLQQSHLDPGQTLYNLNNTFTEQHSIPLQITSYPYYGATFHSNPLNFQQSSSQSIPHNSFSQNPNDLYHPTRFPP